MSAMNLDIELNGSGARVGASYAKKVALGAGCVLLAAGSAWRQATSANLVFVASSENATTLAAIKTQFEAAVATEKVTDLDGCSASMDAAVTDTCLVKLQETVVAKFEGIDVATDGWEQFKALVDCVDKKEGELFGESGLFKNATGETAFKAALQTKLQMVNKATVFLPGTAFPKLCNKSDAKDKKYKVAEVEAARKACETADADTNGDCDKALGTMMSALTDDDDFQMAKKYGILTQTERHDEVANCVIELVAIAKNGMGEHAEKVRSWAAEGSSILLTLLIVFASLLGVGAIGVGAFIFMQQQQKSANANSD